MLQSANENQDTQLQQQILFHDNGEFYQNGHSSSVANQPSNGRHEMINAENTAKNDIQWYDINFTQKKI
ncbi:hypothetical protein T05_16080 [Trichinella murrelli]|uniref:Uncharacterized protein n=1 Tax=Trichinella murrelli TaxID=144512 RepID=A0A0V0U1N2_9BILA|nr:hypothetical protein T05_16080 [Trichinella murrelli]